MDRKRIAILSLSLLTIIYTDTIAPLVQQMCAAFPQISPTLVKMTVTLPALMTIFFGLIAGQMVKVISKKAVLAIGLTMYSVGGVAAGYVHNFTIHLVYRGLVGAGVGLITPIITSLVADYYQGKERADMIGYNFAVSHFAAVITPALASYVGTVSWRNAFLIFLVVPLVFVVAMILLPGASRNNQPGKIKEKAPITTRAMQCAVIAMLLMVFFFVVVTDLSYLLNTKDVVSPFLATFGLSTFTFGFAIAGLAFSWIYLKIQRWVIPSGFVVCGAGYFLVTFSQSNALILAGLLSIGLGMGMLISLLVLQTTNSVGKADSTAAAALTNAGFSTGIFLSPFFYEKLPSIPTGMERIEFNFFLAGGIFLLAGVITLTGLIVRRKKLASQA